MNPKFDYMLGMTQNMMNIAEGRQMQEMYSMTSTMMGNLHHMKMRQDMMDDGAVEMMENMMRNMENVMMTADLTSDQQQNMVMMMMEFMIMSQMQMIMG